MKERLQLEPRPLCVQMGKLHLDWATRTISTNSLSERPQVNTFQALSILLPFMQSGSRRRKGGGKTEQGRKGRGRKGKGWDIY